LVVYIDLVAVWEKVAGAEIQDFFCTVVRCRCPALFVEARHEFGEAMQKMNPLVARGLQDVS
jgi:hypothetical protein